MEKIDTTRPIYAIINPHSGYGGHHLRLHELRSAARQAGWELIEYTTTGPEDATRYARTIADKAAAIIVWGGDGTVNEVASALAGTLTPMLPCPAGTENLLAKELRMPSHPQRIIELLSVGQIVNCDVGHINGRNFLLIIGVGFDGEVVRRLSAVRSGHISHLSYFWPIWRTFWEHNFPRMRIIADGEEIFDDQGLVFIGNISRYAVGLRICRDARYDDGLLDLVVFSCQEQTSLMLHAAWTLLRAHPLKGSVLYKQVRSIHIETDKPVATQIDGDVGPETPIDVSLRGEQVRLIVPPKQNGWLTWPTRGGDLL